MSEDSLVFVGAKQQLSETDIMATKVQIKSEKFTPFGGIFYVLNLFQRLVKSLMLPPTFTSPVVHVPEIVGLLAWKYAKSGNDVTITIGKETEIKTKEKGFC